MKKTNLLLFFIITASIHYVWLLITVGFASPISILRYYMFFTFFTLAPLFFITIPRATFLKNRIYRLLLGVLVGVLVTHLCMMTYYCFSGYGTEWYIQTNIRKFSKYGITYFFVVFVFVPFIYGGIFPGCLYAEIVYKLILLWRKSSKLKNQPLG